MTSLHHHGFVNERHRFETDCIAVIVAVVNLTIMVVNILEKKTRLMQLITGGSNVIGSSSIMKSGLANYVSDPHRFGLRNRGRKTIIPAQAGQDNTITRRMQMEETL